ncbi:MAG: hypothetical protein KGL39_36435 [Patescibacteria group bacterium]|nr:hypothetical protein [Patescibacteria group bacterium]
MTINTKSWRNADGLDVWFGPAEGRSGLGGEELTYGDNRVLQFVLTLTDLTSSAVAIDEHFELPKGAFIEEVDLVVLTGATGTGATLNIGLLKNDDTTNVSDTALVSAVAQTSLTAGAVLKIVSGGTGAGSSIGTTTPTDLATVVTAKYATAAFTAGKVLVRVQWNSVT